MWSTQQAAGEASHPVSAAGVVTRLAHRTGPNLSEWTSHQTVHRFHVQDVDVDVVGVVDGGTLLEWIDDAAHATAARWSRRRCVTASVGNIHLDRPISVGELVEVHASLVYTGRSSMHILVTIHSEDPAEAKADQTSQCSIIFIAIDSTGHPVDVPKWTPVTMLELQRHRQARVRVAIRKRIDDAMTAESYTTAGTAPQATRRFHVAATDTRQGGQVHGGRVMRWIDAAASAAGTEWTGTQVVTSYIAGIRFLGAVSAGDVVEITARIVHTGPRSVHLGIHVTVVDGDRTRLAAHGLAVVVSLDESGDARPVPRWQPDSDEDRRLDRQARHLIALRQFIEPFTTATAVTGDEPVSFAT